MTKYNTELGNIISNAIAAKLTPEFVQEKVNERAEKLVEEAINDAMRSYGDLGKMVKSEIAEALKVNRLDLPTYGHLVTTMLQAQIERLVHPLIAGKLSEDMEELLKLAPKTIKLSEIVKSIMDDNDYTDFGEVCTCIVEVTDYGTTWVYLDETVIGETTSRYSIYSDTDRKKYKCDIQMSIIKDGTISSATFKGDDMKTMRSVGTSHGLEQRIRAYYACGTIIEIDEDDVITSRDYD